MKKFDICFSNPPYILRNDLTIILSILQITDELIVVHPANWLIERRHVVSDLFHKFRTKVENNICSVTLFNNNYIFKTRQFPPGCITHINNIQKNKTINVNYFGDKFQTDNIKDITIHGSNWNEIVKPFISNMNKYIKILGNINNHIIKYKNIDNNKFHCRISSIRGSINENQYKKEWFSPMWKRDIYTFISCYKKATDKTKFKENSILYEFNSKNELINFIEYLKTDFCNFCLSILKAGQGIAHYELQLIPWLDFTQEWTDEKLYDYFNIPQETRIYITNFLKMSDG